MKKITLVLFAMLAFCWQSNAQTSDLYISILDTGNCCNGEKWVSITTGPDGTGTVIFAQGNGTYPDGSGHITDEMFTVDDGVTYYINAYDQYDDTWDGDTYEIRSAPAGGGILVANNGGNTPDDGNDEDASFNWGDTQEQELEVSESFSYTPPSCLGPTTLTATSITDTTADLGWTEAGTATLWNIEIVDAGVTATGVATASGVTNPYTAMGLAQNSDFEFYVQADCGMTDGVSQWVGPFAFSTIASSAPGCPVVTGTPDAVCGNYDSNLSWDAVAGADSYTVSVGTTSGGIDIADNVDLGTALTYDFAGMPSTTYFYTVTAANTVGVSMGCMEASLTTEAGICYCDPSSTNTNTTTFIDNVSTSGASMNLSNLASGLSANHYVDNFATMGVTSFADGSFDFTVEIQGGTLGLAIWIDWNDDLDYEVSENVFTTTAYGNGPFTGTITVPTGTANGDYHMRIMADWNDPNPGDDDACSLAAGRGETEDYKVTVADAPACIGPSALTATNIATTSADLSWTAGGTETLWNIELGLAGFTLTGNPTASGVANPYSAMGLTPVTNYEYYVQADCLANGTSSWVGPFAFVTACDAFNVPFTESFNSDSTTQSCWTVLDENGDGDEWNLDYAFNPFEGDEVAVINTDFNGGANDDWLISPAIILTGDERLKYQYRVQSSFEPNDFEVLLSTTGNSPADFTNTLVANAEYNNTTYEEQIVDLSAYSGTVYIAWHIPNGGPDGWIAFVDDVVVEALPACLEPASVMNSVLTDMSSEFTWTAGGTETVWEYANLPSPSMEPASGTSTMTTMASFTGLTPETDYDFYVRSDCGGTFSSWVLVSYTTPAPPPVNDDIAGAIALTVDEGFCDGTNTNGTNAGSSGSGEGAGSCFEGGVADDDVWFTFTVPATTVTVDVSTDFTGGTLVDTEIAVYSGMSGNLVELACSQDDGVTTLSNGFSWNSLITDLAVTAGETYYVQVAGYNANIGTFCLDVSSNQVLSTNEFENEAAFTYYPNPVKNTLTLNAQNTIENVTMYNMLGQEVLRATPNAVDSDLDMSSLNSGAYFVKVTIANVTQTVRVIKQ